MERRQVDPRGYTRGPLVSPGTSSPALLVSSAFVEALHEFKKNVEENSDYVGDTFPEEARKIHYGETEARSIYGEATPEEAEELVDEGVDFQRIPWTGKSDA